MDHVEVCQVQSATSQKSIPVKGMQFLVACVCKFSKHEYVEFEVSSEWNSRFQECLEKWPSGAAPKAKVCKIKDEKDRHILLSILTDDGVVQKTQGVCGVTLQQGDVLQMTGDMEGHRAADLKKLSGNMLLEFIPCLRLKCATVTNFLPYVEVHEKFMGFREKGHLRVVDGPEAEMCLNMIAREFEDTSGPGMEASGAEHFPRPVRNLSVRRTPQNATDRGCR